MSFDPYSSPGQFSQPLATGEPPKSNKQSGWGVASFLMSLIIGLGMLFVIGWAGYLEVSTPGGIDEDDPLTAMIGFAILGGLGIALIGVVLGIVACAQRTKGRLLGILGLVFNAMILLGTCGLLFVGIVAQV